MINVHISLDSFHRYIDVSKSYPPSNYVGLVDENKKIKKNYHHKSDTIDQRIMSMGFMFTNDDRHTFSRRAYI